MSDQATRRDFLKQAAAGAAAVSALAQEVVAQTTAAGPGGLPTRVLGRTGERVSILALGGWHIGTIADEAEAARSCTRLSTRASRSSTTPGTTTTDDPKS
jgi:hypothetical protein